MSYCRWSTDNYGCDLYCYESAQGWETRVAGLRIVGTIPRITASVDQIDELVAQHRAQVEFVWSAKMRRIGGPYDGQSFTDHTLEEFLDRLHTLRAAGYRFPDSLFDAVQGEIVDRDEDLERGYPCRRAQ